MTYLKHEDVKFITPYLPQDAIDRIKLWQASKKVAVQRVVPVNYGAKCQNCQDHGVVYVSFLGSGPSRAPITIKHPSTYVEGNGKIMEGWYIIENTIGFVCPHCNGNPESIPQEEPQFVPEVETMIQEATGELSIKPKPINADWQDW